MKTELLPENFLYIRLSCLAEKSRWDSYKRSNINQIILCGDPNLDTLYKLDGDILYLKCKDSYEFLPTKMVMAFNTILEDNRFKHITHIHKIDNDIDIDYVWNFVNDNYQLIIENDYLGGRILEAKNPCHWHFDRVPPTSPWRNKRFFEKRIKFASGGYTYILSRKSLEVICAEFNFQNINKVNKRYVLEDVMVGLILERNNIKPVKIDLNVVNTSALKKSKRK